MKLYVIVFLSTTIVLSEGRFSAGKKDFENPSCDFNGKPSFCKWEREWHGMKRAGWRVGRKIRNSKLTDTSGGKFLYFRAKSRPVGFVSRLKSPQFTASLSCLSFNFSIGGSKLPYPDGLSSITLYLVHEALPNVEIPIWEHKTKTSRSKFEKVAFEIPNHAELLRESENKDVHPGSVHLIFETIRGKSKRAFVMIDDFKVYQCQTLHGHSLTTRQPPKTKAATTTTAPTPLETTTIQTQPIKNELGYDGTSDFEEEILDDRKELIMKGKDAGNIILRQLPAKRGGIRVMQLLPEGSISNVQTSAFSFDSLDPIGSLVEPELPTHVSALSFLPTPIRRTADRNHVVPRKKGKRRKHRKKHRKHRKGSHLFATKKTRLHNTFISQLGNTAQRQVDHGFGDVFIEEQPTSSRILLPTLDSFESSVACDFIEYTQRLQSCFRAFFSILFKKHRGCRTLYSELELCLVKSAQSCVSSREISDSKLSALILDTMRNNFQTKKVYCEEDGAFVFPKFAVEKLPIQCGPRYFIKLSQCGSPFSNIFNFEHGNSQLCKEYYGANECQRRTTGQECNFDSETMLSYGLSLQYQFAHNPFCLHLPFSAWWPENN